MVAASRVGGFGSAIRSSLFLMSCGVPGLRQLNLDYSVVSVSSSNAVNISPGRMGRIPALVRSPELMIHCKREHVSTRRKEGHPKSVERP
jgi:hypothetical protein